MKRTAGTRLGDLRSHLLLPLTLGMTVLLCTIVFGVYLSERRELQRDVAQRMRSVQRFFQDELDHESQLILATLESISRDEKLKGLFLQRDRQALLAQTAPLFEELRSQHQITHFCFTRPDRVSFLRVHRPELHGDRIDRYTTLEAERTGYPFSGLDLGRFRGLFTLRVVFPWYDRDELIGYVELGKEIDHVAKKLYRGVDGELLVVMYKDFLVREYWEEVMNAFDRALQWDRFPDLAIVNQTFDVLPSAIAESLADPSIRHSLRPFSANVAGKRYQGSFQPILDAANEEIGLLVILLDCTDQHAAVFASVAYIAASCFGVGGVLFLFFFLFLRRLEHKLHEDSIQLTLQSAALESAANAIVITDRDGTITWVNRAFCQLTGYSFDECAGLNSNMLKSGADDDKLYEEMWETIRGGHVWRGEITGRRKNGSLYQEEMIITPVPDESGEITNYIAIKQDITERKRAEEELREVRDAALEASGAKSEFLANMSHEIRTPLNGIIGMAELTLETDLTLEQHDNLSTLKASADTLLTVINDILDFSKIEAGKLELDLLDFRLRDTAADTVRSLALKAHQKGLEVACHVAPDVPDALVGDSNRLRQVLINLVGNAIKFTDRGEVMLSVCQVEASADETVLRFSISDTGIGIPPDVGRSIFRSFTQADGSTTRKYGGTGLGLAISSNLVRLMGGEIGLESAPGEGSTFTFTARFGVRGEQPEESSRETLASLHGCPVLVVDDNATNRYILKEMVSSWNMIPTAAASGPEALEELMNAARAGSPHRLALIDFMMPEMDGFDLAEHIRLGYGCGAPRMILLTSANRHGDSARATELGIEAILTKPVKQSDLLETILKACSSDPIPQIETECAVPIPCAERGPHLNILLAEDNVVNQKVATRMLEKEGHAVVVVTNGREALQACTEQSFDLVLMDIHMPEMGGFEATAVIREREESTGAHLPIIALTANAMKGAKEGCLEAGMDDYLPKPVRVSDLRAKIAHLMGSEAGAT